MYSIEAKFRESIARCIEPNLLKDYAIATLSSKLYIYNRLKLIGLLCHIILMFFLAFFPI